MQVTVILFFFLFHSFVYLASTSAPTPSSRCGLLNINCPFLLKGSPASCKYGFFEVLCEGNDTVFYLGGNKYLVTEIFYDEETFRLVDPTLLSSPCPIPKIFPPIFNLSENSIFHHWGDNPQAYYFLNCSKQLNVSQHIPVPCLSFGGSNIYVDRVYHSDYSDYYDYLNFLPNSCSSFAGILSDENRTTGSDVFLLLRKGFLLHWTFYYPHFSVKQCKRMFRDRHRWSNISLGDRIRRVLRDEHFMLSCVFYDQNHIIFGLEVLSTLCVNIAVILLVCRIIFAPVILYIFLMYKYWNSFLNSIDAVEKFLRRHATFSVRRYDFSDVVAITNHFREKLGHGGFGAVYKGNLINSSFVAVKILNDSKFGGDDFINEVGTIGKIHHTNIVQLIGFCSEASKRALIYEYMPKGSLDKYIFPRTRSNDTTLTIEKRKEIAIGIARGIDYLHRGCEMQILHFDIKPHNILLDNNLNPKISDFGMAKLYPREYNSVAVSAYGGTLGYIAPELVSRSFGTISNKADVYSFGMLLLELAGGRKNVDFGAGNQNQVYYPSWIYDQLTQREKNEVSNVTVDVSEIEGILAKVGLWCIQSNPSNRPSMSRVIEMLQMEKDYLEMPPKPFANTTPEENSTLDSIPEFGSIELSVISEEISLIE